MTPAVCGGVSGCCGGFSGENGFCESGCDGAVEGAEDVETDATDTLEPVAPGDVDEPGLKIEEVPVETVPDGKLAEPVVMEVACAVVETTLEDTRDAIKTEDVSTDDFSRQES